MKLKASITLLGIILISSLLVIFVSQNQDNNKKNELVSIDVQPKEFERSFVEKKLHEHVQFTDSTQLIVPASIQLIDSTLYISDFSDFSIYQFHYDGTLLQKLETGIGEGPGEFRHLSGFDIKGRVLWAVDQSNLRVSSFDLDTGQLKSSFSVQRRPWRITTVSDGLIILWLGSDKLFTKFDFEGNELISFGELTEDQIQNPLSFDGEVASNRNNLFVYVPRYASFIYVYDYHGELQRVLLSPDGLGFQRSVQQGNLYQAPTIDNNYVMLDPMISNNNILSVYVAWSGENNLTNADDEQPVAMIDLYDIKKGVYLNSITLPFDHEIGKYDSQQKLFFSTTAYEGNTYRTKFLDGQIMLY